MGLWQDLINTLQAFSLHTVRNQDLEKVHPLTPSVHWFIHLVHSYKYMLKRRVPEEKNGLIQRQCENALMARECR